MRGRVEAARVAAGHRRCGRTAAYRACPLRVVGAIACIAVDVKPKRGSRLRRMANIEAASRACLLVDRHGETGRRWAGSAWTVVDGWSPTRSRRGG
jgi:hypothetical protein